jgi:hypothetical protein
MLKLSIQTALIGIFIAVIPFHCYAETGEDISTFYTNLNIALTPHPEPETFEVTLEKEIFGFTTNNVEFSQINLCNDFTKLQKFQIQEAWWYISDKGIIGYGEGISDLQALSIYLALK